jgi:hypothetical protein
MNRLLVVALALAACKTNEAPARKPAPTDVEVLAPGAAPQKVVRYAVPKGTTSTIELTTDWQMSAGEMAMALPTIVTTFEIGCDDVAPDGTMKLHAKVLDATAHERPDSKVNPASIASELEPLKGTTLAMSLAPDGRAAQATVVPGQTPLSPQVTEQMTALAASLSQLAMSLPSTPIGVGAKWRTSRKITQGGLALTTVTTVDVTGLDANGIAFTLASEIHGADQTVTQNGLSVEMKDVRGTATGKGTIELTKGITTGELHFDLKSQMSAAAGSATQMHVMTDLTIR